MLRANHACGAEVSLRLFRHHIRLAETVAELVRKDARFELSAPPRFGLVCFHLKVRPSPHAYNPAQSSHGYSILQIQMLPMHEQRKE